MGFYRLIQLTASMAGEKSAVLIPLCLFSFALLHYKTQDISRRTMAGINNKVKMIIVCTPNLMLMKSLLHFLIFN